MKIRFTYYYVDGKLTGKESREAIKKDSKIIEGNNYNECLKKIKMELAEMENKTSFEYYLVDRFVIDDIVYGDGYSWKNSKEGWVKDATK